MEPGTCVERYEIVREIGRGGMAVVYEARHQELGSRHALKVLHPGPPELAERLVREGSVQARLSHPNLVAVTDVVTVDGRPGLVLELVDGTPLDAWLVDHADADDATRRAVFAQIASAVQYAHERGTIHRDLKPGNVIVTPELRVKVADFGLARWLDAPDAPMTRTGLPLGTPRYMAPEQIQDGKHVDQRADVFALGCILADLWGAPAFDEAPIPDLFEAIVEGRYRVPAGAPDDVARAIHAALQPNLERRVPTVSALVALLGRRPAPALARPASVVAPAAAAVAGGLTVFTGALAGAVTALWIGFLAADAATPAPAAPAFEERATRDVPAVRTPPPRRGEPGRRPRSNRGG